MEILLTQLVITSILCAVVMLIVQKLTPALELRCKSKVIIYIAIAIYIRSLFVVPLPAFPGKGVQMIQGIVLVLQAQRQGAFAEAIQTVSHAVPFSPIGCLFFLWLAVFVLLVLFYTAADLNDFLRSRTHRHIIAVPEILDALSTAKKDMNVTAPVSLFASQNIFSPSITGIWTANHTTIYIPEFFYIRYKKGLATVRDFYLIFRHELAHYVACDHISGPLISLACYGHWFNPFFHKFKKIVNGKIECARDDMALMGLGIEDAKQMDALLVYFMNIQIAAEKAKKNWWSLIFSHIHGLSPVEDFDFRRNNLYDTRSPNVNFKYFVITAIVMAISVVVNCSGLMNAMLSPANWSLPWKTVEASSTFPGGEISFAYPIANPTEILTPSAFERNPNFPVNRVVFAADLGTDVYAPISGEVVQLGYLDNTQMGNSIKIKNDQLIITIGHFSSSTVSIGEIVTQNQVIGKVDSSGRCPVFGSEIFITDLNENPINLKMYVDGYAHISI